MKPDRCHDCGASLEFGEYVVRTAHGDVHRCLACWTRFTAENRRLARLAENPPTRDPRDDGPLCGDSWHRWK